MTRSSPKMDENERPASYLWPVAFGLFLSTVFRGVTDEQTLTNGNENSF